VGLSEYVANKAYANCVSPSMTRTALTAGVDEPQIDEAVAGHPLGRLVTPNEVAEAVLFPPHASAHVNGVNMLVNSGVDMV